MEKVRRILRTFFLFLHVGGNLLMALGILASIFCRLPAFLLVFLLKNVLMFS